MNRQLEPELMEEEEQVKSYAEADFTEAHQRFIDLLLKFVDPQIFSGSVLDLGCGPGDISRRLVSAYPSCRLTGVDGSLPMLNYAKKITSEDIRSRIQWVHDKLQALNLPESSFDIIISTSLLHHLPDPHVLWQAIKKYAQPGARIAVMDLLRPKNEFEARKLVAQAAQSEPEILQHDFYHSLLAAFTLDEIRQQLEIANLNLNVEQISDRHVFITGVALI